jgi:hypothetical protein
MFGLMSNWRAVLQPNVLIPLLTLTGAVLVERRSGEPQMAQLTDIEGEPILVKPGLVYALQPSSIQVRLKRTTNLMVIGLERPLVVLESISEVAQRLGGIWVARHVPGSMIDIGKGRVQVLVDPSRVITVEPSSYRVKTNRLTDVIMAQDYTLRVFEDVPTVARLLGM